MGGVAKQWIDRRLPEQPFSDEWIALDSTRFAWGRIVKRHKFATEDVRSRTPCANASIAKEPRRKFFCQIRTAGVVLQIRTRARKRGIDRDRERRRKQVALRFRQLECRRQ